MIKKLKKLNLSAIISMVKRLVTDYPVELLACVAAYSIMFCGNWKNDYNAFLLPLTFSVAYVVNNFTRYSRLSRVAYYATTACVVVSCVVNAESFVGTKAYAFALLLSAIFLVLSDRGKSDDEVSGNFIKVMISAVVAASVAAVLCGVISAIFCSIIYIFGLHENYTVLERLLEFVLFVVMPSTFLLSADELSKKEYTLTKFADVLCNYILGSALIVYTAILYVYMVKIVVTATLPLGGLAALITAFYVVAFVWMLLQQRLDNKYYRWLHKWFGYISLPLLIMFFVGLLYRIGEYGFTEGRVYMLAAGIVMVIGSLVLIFVKRNRFNVIFYSAVALIVITTYVPYVTAKDFGVRSQTNRMVALARNVGAYDAKTGRLKWMTKIDKEHIDAYVQMSEAYDYLCSEKSAKYMVKKYGRINYSLVPEKEDYVSVYDQRYDCPDNVEVGEYRYLVTGNHYVSIADGVVNVRNDDGTIFEAPYKKIPEDVENPDKGYFIYTNDEYMLVVLSISKGYGEPVYVYESVLFRKSAKARK